MYPTQDGGTASGLELRQGLVGDVRAREAGAEEDVGRLVPTADVPDALRDAEGRAALQGLVPLGDGSLQ